MRPCKQHLQKLQIIPFQHFRFGKNFPLVAETSKVNMVIIIAATDSRHANKPEDLENQMEITHANQKN